MNDYTRTGWLVSAVFVAALVAAGAASGHDIVIDGLFDDWARVPVAYQDPKGDHLGGPVDFGALKVESDAGRFYLYFEIGSEMSLQEANGIVLFLDTDDDASTGHVIGEMGADFEWRFGERTGVVYHGDGQVTIAQAQVGLRQGPTVTSTAFEVSFDRESFVAESALLPGGTVGIAFTSWDKGPRDTLPNRDETLAVDLKDDPPPQPCRTSFARRQLSDVRVLTFNVLHDGLFKRPRVFDRIIRALDPDVICFQEIGDHTEKEIADRMMRVFPRQTWAAAFNSDAAIATRYTIRNSGSGRTGRAVWAQINLPDDRYDVDLSVVSAHLPCCRDNEGRQSELDAIARWHTQLRTTGLQTLPHGTPIIVAGDMNFVGPADQVESLLSGTIVDKETFGHSVPIDWDETGLVDAMPYHTTCREAYTWRDDTDVFAPGRLDYIVYSNSVLELRNKFIVCTEEMSLGDLSSANLKVNDTKEASDHLPVVADFAILRAP